MKRFYREAAAAAQADGHAVLLDGRPVRTPARAPLLLPTAALAQAVVEEWAAQGDTIDPASMPFTGFANAAIDRIAPDPAAFAKTVSVYGESDLLCYRADSPAELAQRQAGQWQPLLDWASRRYDVAFAVTSGIVHVAQPEPTRTRLHEAAAARSPFALAALAPLVGLSGSLVIGLAAAEGAFDIDELWQAAELDELWQVDQWGDDDEARARRNQRRDDFHRAARFAALAAQGA